jgi:hypothetical protein
MFDVHRYPLVIFAPFANPRKLAQRPKESRHVPRAASQILPFNPRKPACSAKKCAGQPR